MEIEIYTCNNLNCNKKFVRDINIINNQLPHSNKDVNTFLTILDVIMQTKLFCVDCSVSHAKIIRDDII
jgi:hypothetical protein